MSDASSFGIFVSYRREDSRADAGRLYDRLQARFGDKRVFMDVDDIHAGQNFVEVLRDTLANCRAMIVVIGPDWARSRDATGASRLAKSDDFVHQEVSTALKRGIEIIPVLVNRAVMPAAGQLPPDLAALTENQAIELSDTRFHEDVDRLIKALDTLASRGALTRGRLVTAALLILVAISAALFWSGVQQIQSRSPAAGIAGDDPRETVDTAPVVTLRSEPAGLNSAEVTAMLAEKNFFDAARYPAGAGLVHDYATRVRDGQVVVDDSRTGLVWQQSGSERSLPFDQVGAYLATLNGSAFAGYRDWRLPTLEEAMSLLSPLADDGVHVATAFARPGAGFVWTADNAADQRHWVVYAYDGTAQAERDSFNAWVRAVRTARVE